MAFINFCYLYKAPYILKSANNDLLLLKKTKPFKNHMSSKTFLRHLCYPNEPLVGIAFFDQNVTLKNTYKKRYRVKSLSIVY